MTDPLLFWGPHLPIFSYARHLSFLVSLRQQQLLSPHARAIPRATTLVLLHGLACDAGSGHVGRRAMAMRARDTPSSTVFPVA